MENKNNNSVELVKEDMVQFIFRFPEDATLSERIEHLLIPLSINKMELLTGIDLPDEITKEKPVKINSISMVGDASYIFNNLQQIKPDLIKFISDYISSGESYVNKILELRKSQYLIHDYQFSVNWNEPIFYNPAAFYRVHFNKLIAIDLHTTQIEISDKALGQINDQVTLRNDFLGLLSNFINLQLEKIDLLEIQKELPPILEEDVEKEMQLFEVWFGLKACGFLDHLKTNVDIARHRESFYASFNLKDRNYKNRQANYPEKKGKGQFLESLTKKFLSLMQNKPETKK